MPRVPQSARPVSRASLNAPSMMARSTNCWAPDEVSCWRPKGALNWPNFTRNTFFFERSQSMLASSSNWLAGALTTSVQFIWSSYSRFGL